MAFLGFLGWWVAFLVFVVLVGRCRADRLRQLPEPPTEPPPEPLPVRQVPIRPPTPLPRAFRRPITPVPPHEDPPLNPADLAHVVDRWPHLISSYYREDHHR